MKYAVVTFGCRVNQADSLRLEEGLCARGATEASADDADLVIVNSCSVTSAADQGTRQTIRRIARTNPSARILVTGCYATRRPEDVAALPGVVRVVGNDDKLRAIELLQCDGELTTAERFGAGEGACGAVLSPGIAGRTTFTLRVQTGCEERCAYCIIPATRGVGRSTPAVDVCREVERIAAAGFREITLTGVHLGSYGRDLTPPSSLGALLASLAALQADVTFRISSLEPMDCTPEVVDVVVGSSGRFAPHFHLPLQHASDRVLSLMRRPYSLAVYHRLVEAIVKRLPHVSVGTDMIVGFPGETAADFDRCVAYLSGSPLSHVHVFPYSDRPGTAASSMTEKVDKATVRARGATIRAIATELAHRFRQSQVGTVRPGLTLDDGTRVVTDNYLKVRVAPGLARNTRVDVRLEADGAAAVVSTAPSRSRVPDGARAPWSAPIR